MKKLILLLLIAQIAFGQVDYASYLSSNKQEIKFDETEKFEILENDFNTNQIFLFGENHGAAQPHELDFLLFKTLYYKQKVRHYIAEIDPAKAWLLNTYLKDGDENKLKKIFKSWQLEGAQWANYSNYNKYVKLHQFYKSLSKGQKFTVIGIDVIQDYKVLNEYVKHLLPKKSSKTPLFQQLSNTLDTIKYENRKYVGEIARKIQTELSTNKNYKKELKANYKAFELMIKNAGYVGNKMYRDSIMYRTFEDASVAHQLERKKLYGFLGFYHTLQTNYGKSTPFASHLKNNKDFNKIVSIQMLALNSLVLLPYNAEIKKIMPKTFVEKLRNDNPTFPKTEKYIPYELSNDNFMMKVDGIEELKKQTSANSTTIFKLNTTNSPYKSGKLLAEVTGFQTLKMDKPTDSTLEAFQYVVLFRNSPAGIPILE